MHFRVIRYGLILALLLPSNILAADYLSTNATVMIYVRSALGVAQTNTTYITDTTGALWIRDGIAEVEPLLKTIKSVDSFVTTYKQGVYSLATDVIGVTGVVWSKNDSLKSLVFMPKEKWYEVVPKEDQENQDKDGFDVRPGYYDVDDDRIYLYPPPLNTGDTIKVFSWKSNNIGDAFDTTQTLATMPQEYRKAVLKYVIWQAGQARQDIRTEIFKRDYDEMLAKISQSKGVRVAETAQ